MPLLAVADNVLFGALMAALYVGIQSVVVVAHEFAHSTTAWLLGYTSTPFTVVWGNPITMLGWDEGVPYDQLFASGGRPAEAAITTPSVQEVCPHSDRTTA
jgi:hypothetical protein